MKINKNLFFVLLVVLSLLLSACGHAQALSPAIPSFPPLPEIMD